MARSTGTLARGAAMDLVPVSARRIGRQRTANLLGSGWLLCLVGLATVALGQEIRTGDAEWLWTPEQAEASKPVGVAYFRKVFPANNPESAQIEITADDQYELFVNGRRVGQGNNWQRLDVYDVVGFVHSGRNVVAVRVENTRPGPAGVVVRVTVRNKGNTDVSFSSDNTWRVAIEEQRFWQQPNFDDGAWARAASLGELGRAAPWGAEVQTADGARGGRFRIVPEFIVERVAAPEAAGSIVAMAFTEGGNLVVSREGGPLYLLRDEDRNGSFEKSAVYCDEVKNCQGILPLNGQVFAVGDGPEKTAFYQLADENRDGQADKVVTLFKFKGGMGEHGPHAPVLGPDGLIYLIIGNHSSVDATYEATSPHQHYYEGDLVQPKYEDAGGHAVGIKAPGGVVVRTDIQGSFVELVCGGFRNAYDLCFDAYGELFTFDSDMEWDVGLPWYRPTRVNHIIPGAEFGWRSGWSKWPDYYVDSLGSVLDVGRGSPTGVECYNHFMFPQRYHNALFVADWSMGRILAVRTKPADGTYLARSEIFLQGRPLNVTDLAVGPDGWLYFSTGGRGTEGGVYRIRWQGKVPPQPRYRGVMQAVRQPQPTSAWGRNRIANLRQQMGDTWDEQIGALVRDRRAAPADRARALDLMQLVGPFPTSQLLVEVSQDPAAELRAKAAYLMGVNADDETAPRLVELLDDADPLVRRRACEAFVRSGYQPPVEKLLGLLADRSRYVSWAARRAIERVPRDQWQSVIMATDNARQFIVGATALLVLDPDRVTVGSVLSRSSQWMRNFMEDEDFLGMLRVIELALHRGNLKGDDVQELRQLLAEEYPALEPRMNRELVRLLVYLDEPSILPRLMEQVASTEVPVVEKLHAALHARFLTRGWGPDERLEMLRFYEYAGGLTGGHSFKGYVDNATRDFCAQLSPDEDRLVLDAATEIPNAAVNVLRKFQEAPGEELLARLMRIDRDLGGVEGEAAARLRTAIVAILGVSRSPDAMAYLRDAFEREPDRRADLAMGLAQDADGENWPLLVRALPLLEGPAAEEVLVQLEKVDRAPDKPEPLRQVILCGLKLKERSPPAVKVLEKWTGESASAADAKWDAALGSWQEWFAQRYPNEPPAALPSGGTKWTMAQLTDYLNQSGSAGNPARGEQVFVKAQCIKCHRYGSRGEGIGPDLSAVSQRFQKREILESVLFPSQVISDQYASKIVVTRSGQQFAGIVDTSRPDVVVVLESNGEKRSVPRDEIEELAPSSKSAMPEGLFDELTLEDIADLFAYLSRPPLVR